MVRCAGTTHQVAIRTSASSAASERCEQHVPRRDLGHGLGFRLPKAANLVLCWILPGRQGPPIHSMYHRTRGVVVVPLTSRS
jgi:hypothetical protein